MRHIILSFAKLVCVCVHTTAQATYEWEMFLFAGTDPADKIPLRSRSGSLAIRRCVKSAFRPASKTNENIDVALDGFFTLSPFAIDRANVRLRLRPQTGIYT